jgi:hypothetical protein
MCSGDHHSAQNPQNLRTIARIYLPSTKYSTFYTHTSLAQSLSLVIIVTHACMLACTDTKNVSTLNDKDLDHERTVHCAK